MNIESEIWDAMTFIFLYILVPLIIINVLAQIWLRFKSKAIEEDESYEEVER